MFYSNIAEALSWQVHALGLSVYFLDSVTTWPHSRFKLVVQKLHPTSAAFGGGLPVHDHLWRRGDVATSVVGARADFVGIVNQPTYFTKLVGHWHSHHMGCCAGVDNRGHELRWDARGLHVQQTWVGLRGSQSRGRAYPLRRYDGSGNVRKFLKVRLRRLVLARPDLGVDMRLACVLHKLLILLSSLVNVAVVIYEVCRGLADAFGGQSFRKVGPQRLVGARPYDCNG